MKLPKTVVAACLILVMSTLLLPAPPLTYVAKTEEQIANSTPRPLPELEQLIAASEKTRRNGNALFALGCIPFVLGAASALSTIGNRDGGASKAGLGWGVLLGVPGAILMLVGGTMSGTARGKIHRLEKEKKALSVGLAFDSRHKIAGIGLRFEL